MSQSLMDRYDDRIAGVLSCYDRVVITGTLPGVCYADGMTRYLNANGIRIFDYPQFAMELRDRVRSGAASLARAAYLGHIRTAFEHDAAQGIRGRSRFRAFDRRCHGSGRRESGKLARG